MLAEGAIYRMRHDMPNAVSAFARANALAPENDNNEVQRSLHETAGEEGMPVNGKFNVLSDFSVAPVFDNLTIYVTDAKLFGLNGNTSQLPTGRRLVETQFTQGFRYHPEFGIPNTTIGAATAGVISAQNNPPRDIQFALKLIY